MCNTTKHIPARESKITEVTKVTQVESEPTPTAAEAPKITESTKKATYTVLKNEVKFLSAFENRALDLGPGLDLALRSAS